MSELELVLAALRVLGARPSLAEIETIAAALRNSGDPEVEILFGHWERLRALVLNADEALAFTALDLFSEFKSPGGQREVLARGQDNYAGRAEDRGPHHGVPPV